MGSGVRLGLALGGGFLRGVAHIGVLKVLAAEGIQPQMVAGTSAGSIVAALYCGGWGIREMEQLALSLRPHDIYDFGPMFFNLGAMAVKVLADAFHLPFPFPSPLGLMSGYKLESWISRLLGRKTFRQLARQLAITAVDIHRGHRIVFVSEVVQHRPPSGDIYFIAGLPVAPAVRASCAVPGLFEPRYIGGRLLVDGGLRENVPVEVLHLLGADVVVAVDLGYEGEEYKPVENMVQLLSQSLDIISTEVTRLKLAEYAHVVIRPVLTGVTPWDFSRVAYCITRGEEAARQALPEIKRLL
ncbi:patatin-like phospholipase family protein [Desulfofundulus thermobenzoicus]|uniref:Patatin-like phospholipase family protein n=1 Tax=Desulfofundulus thermobenzoicus TaxID=29376 RepID=A0A6N7IRY5_9FIRM|nr:patatin-like phospholipase family protein [Desulfofundulus thermobenzoicus]MQL52323.1 patatin-like phospholipase family protein [Desulfofundulus thermobenzoicus]HHW43264.1 patatin-like phospholipase family protein [Desulfotomaculum sp.]